MGDSDDISRRRNPGEQWLRTEPVNLSSAAPLDYMEEVRELIRRYGLQEDLEHVIIPLRDEKGREMRCFLLKRKYLRIVYPDGNYADYPLEEVIEATVQYPLLPLSKGLDLLHEELDAQIAKIFENEKGVTDQ